jgi:putative ABC transport system permease protein
MKTAARTLRKSPGFTIIAVLTLAVGIGGATAIFSVADAVILRPLPYEDTDRLVFVSLSDRERKQSFVEFSYPAYREWRDRTRLVESLAAMSSVNDEAILTRRGEPAAVEGRWVTGEFFSVLGVQPARGRALRLEDDRAGAPEVVVISHQFWRDRLSANPAVIGESITLDGKPRTIVGVMPAGFAYPKGAQYWVPVGPAAGALTENRGVFWMVGIGRLRAEASLESARMELTGIWHQAYRQYFKVDGYASVLTPLSDTILGLRGWRSPACSAR